ncbi:MAG: hypothetical protein ACK5UC_03745 [Planctomycetaceae bacterium]
MIGIVLATSLTVGRQLIEWWHDDSGLEGPRAPVGVDLPAWDGHDGPLLVEFGRLPVQMRQELIQGSLDEAQQALRDRLARSLASSPQASDSRGANEQRILELVSQLPPPVIWTRAGLVTDFEEQLLGALAIRLGPGETLPERILTGRLTAWGLLWPAPDRAWRLYEFQRVASTSNDDPLRIDGPPESVRLLAVGHAESGALLAFRGPGTLGAWQSAFDEELTSHGWQRLGNWQGPEGSRGAQFSRPNPRGRELADLRLVRDNSGTLLAMVQVLRERSTAPPDLTPGTR